MNSASIWGVIGSLVLLGLWGCYWGLRQLLRAARRRSAMTESLAAGSDGADNGKSEVAVLRKNMLDAIATIKTPSWA